MELYRVPGAKCAALSEPEDEDDIEFSLPCTNLRTSLVSMPLHLRFFAAPHLARSSIA